MPTIRAAIHTLISSLLFTQSAIALDQTSSYIGEARKNGELVYIERHYLTYDQSGKLKSAETLYIDKDGKEIARLNSNFLSSLTAPDHVLENLITGNVQGIKRNSSKIMLFSKNKNELEKSKVLDDEAEFKTLMGCQGLNYFLIENLSKMSSLKSLPVRFLIPGKLDYYDFTINYLSENSEGIVDFEITIDNWFLSIFSSSLKVSYDKNIKRIVRYEGLSNIPDRNGKLQNVEITYKQKS